MCMFPNNQKSIIDFRLSVNFMAIVYFQGSDMNMNDVLTNLNKLKKCSDATYFSFSFDE